MKRIGLVVMGLFFVGCAGTLGGQTRDALRAGMTGKQPELRQCYADALLRNRESAGTVEVAVHIKKGTKSVHQVDVAESQIQDAEMQACVQRALTGVTIEQAPEQNVRAHFLLNFQPDGELAPTDAAGAAGGTVPAEGEEVPGPAS